MKTKITIFALVLGLMFTNQAVFATATSEALARASEVKSSMIKGDPQLQKDFDNAYGYVIFETIGKGAWVIGGASGKGIVYEQGEQIGSAKMSQLIIGAAVGGQSYSQVIFFENKEALDRFKENKLEMSAQVSAVAGVAGVAQAAPYIDGVKIATDVKGGFMAEASAGGQKLKFKANA